MSDISMEAAEAEQGGGSSAFRNFEEEDRLFLASLPYRVGFWISQYDQRGGEESDLAEMSTLESLITSYAQDMCKPEFMQSLMEETIRCKSSWDAWRENIDKVPEECRDARVMLSDRLDARDRDGFGRLLFEIAVAVADAFAEEDPETPSPFNWVADVFKGLFGAAPKDDDLIGYRNISSQEKAALAILKGNLGG